MSKSEEVRQEKDIKPKRSYKKHSLKVFTLNPDDLEAQKTRLCLQDDQK